MSILPYVEKAAELVMDEVPGASLIHGFINIRQSQRRERLQQEFLSDLAIRIAQDETDYDAVRTKMKEEWAQEAIDRGYLNIMQALSREARAYVAALVALYVKDRRAPDRAYKRVGALFADSTAEDLELLRQIGASIIAVAPVLANARGRHVRLSAEDDTHPPNMWIGARDDNKNVAVVGPVPAPANLAAVVQLLRQNNIGRSADEWGRAGGGVPTPIVFDAGEHIETIEIMMRCLGRTGPDPEVVYTNLQK